MSANTLRADSRFSLADGVHKVLWQQRQKAGELALERALLFGVGALSARQTAGEFGDHMTWLCDGQNTLTAERCLNTGRLNVFRVVCAGGVWLCGVLPAPHCFVCARESEIKPRAHRADRNPERKMLALLAASQGLLVQPAPKGQAPIATRRGVLSGALASVAFAAAPAFAEQSDLAKDLAAGKLSKDEYYAAIAARKEAERVAVLPVNRLKVLRQKLATCDAAINSGDWDGVRDIIRESTTKELIAAVNAGGYGKKDEGKILTTKIRKAVYNVDLAAYGQQDLFGGIGGSYCAEGVVPREGGGCKPRPSVDKAPLLAGIKDALSAFDQLIAMQI